MNAAYHANVTGPRTGRGNWGWAILAPVIWVVPVLILMGIMAGLSGTFFGAFYGAPLAGLIGALWVSWCLWNYVRKVRRRDGLILLSYFEMALRMNLPLMPFLVACELSERGRRARELRTIRMVLASGFPLSAALQAAPDIPEDVVQLVAAHEPLGQVGAALERFRREQEIDENDRPIRQDQSFYRFYPAALVFVVTLMLLAYSIYLLPKFREIFLDFKADLPPITRFAMHVGAFMDQWGVLVLIGLGVVVLGLILSACLMLHSSLLRSMPLPRLKPLLDWLAWHTPLWRGLERDRAMAQLCQLLADATATGVPLPNAVQLAATLPVNAGFRRRLFDFRRQLLQGKSPADAARAARLPDMLAAMLASPTPDGGSAMLAFLARYYRDKFSRSLMLLNAAVEPAMVLAVGSLVLFAVLTVFLPLVQLLNSMEGPGGGFL